MFMLGAVSSLLGGGSAAGAATAGAAATGSGFSIGSVLQGLATVGGVVASIAAGNAQAAQYEMQARDAQANKSFETLQGVDRRRSLLAEAQDAVGKTDVAYAGSGLDLSFGSAREARQRVYRNTDMAVDSSEATTAMRLSRLDEQAANYWSMAKSARSMGLFQGLLGGLQGVNSILQQV